MRARVETADDALQFGEFLDHFGGEIGFRKQSRALGVIVAAEFFDQRDDALGFFQIGAELGLKGDLCKILDAIGERLLLIDVPEEAGVVEAGAQDSFVAVPDQAFGIAVGIHDRDEMRREQVAGCGSTEKYF